MNDVIDVNENEQQTQMLDDSAQVDVQDDQLQEPIEQQELVRIIEAVLFAADQPLSVKQLQKTLLHPEYAQPTFDDIKQALSALQEQYVERGIALQEVASGYRFQIKPDYACWINQLWDEKPPRYSRALLETLVLIAYRQPITRAEIEDVRGVAVSTNIMKTLVERGWVRSVGHRDVPGKPSLYATTKAFLDYFNLPSLESLPTLEAVRDLDSIAAELGDEFAQVLAQQETNEILAKMTEVEVEAKIEVDNNDAEVGADINTNVNDSDIVDNTNADIAETAELDESVDNTVAKISEEEIIEDNIVATLEDN